MTLEEIGERVKSIRGDMPQQAFAAALGIDRKTVFNYETGKRAPDAEVLIRLYEQFRVDPLWVLTGENKPTAPERMKAEERQVLSMYRRLDPERQRTAWLMVTALMEASLPGSIGSKQRMAEVGPEQKPKPRR